MTPADLGLTSAVLLSAVTEMFTTLAPFIVVILPVVAVVVGVKWGIKRFTKVGQGKTP